MVGGYCGRVLRVDLTSGRLEMEPLDYGEARQFIGGRGWGAKRLFELLSPGIDPLGPENPLIFATGPLTGTPLPGNSRYGQALRVTIQRLAADVGGGWEELSMQQRLLVEGAAIKALVLSVMGAHALAQGVIEGDGRPVAALRSH